MPHILSIKKSELYAICLLMTIIMETAFVNTPLQTYNLFLNRIIFFLEIIIFIIFLTLEKYTKKSILFLLGLCLIFLCSYFVLNSSILFKMFMIAMAVAKIGTGKSFELVFKFKTFFLLVIIGLSVLGIIPNSYVQIEKGIGTTYGYGLGFTHPNRLASAICFTILCYICWKNEKLKFKNVLTIGFITLISFYITKSRTLLYCISIFVMFYVFLKTNLTKKYIKKFLENIGIISVPLSIAISVVLPVLLLTSTGTIQRIVFDINRLFSRRFTHIEHIFLTYPVSLTGGLFDTNSMEELFGYSVVDNGYINFLYQYGIIGLALFATISVVSFIKIKKKKEYIWMIIFIIVAIEGLLENIYINIGLNLLVLFWGEVMNTKRKELRQ